MRHGALAQLVEQLTLNQPVPGSSPGRLTIVSKPDRNAPKSTPTYTLPIVMLRVTNSPDPVINPAI